MPIRGHFKSSGHAVNRNGANGVILKLGGGWKRKQEQKCHYKKPFEMLQGKPLSTDESIPLTVAAGLVNVNEKGVKNG
ncbi:MAG: hypothetical protein CL607_28455 [Anaerolineaceae bacterium]|nr:hypothetical protein [Anaerolineaceae bacterium]